MDDLLDLDLTTPSSASSSSTIASTTKLKAQSAYGTGRTAFDYLAQPGASRPASTSPSPALTPRSSSPLVIPSSSSLNPQRAVSPVAGAVKTTTAGGDDAFSSLFGGGGGSGSTPTMKNGKQPLSMAERLAKENATKFGGTYASNGSNASRSEIASPAIASGLGSGSGSSDPWDFDMLAKAAPSASSMGSIPTSTLDPFDMGFETKPNSHLSSSANTLHSDAQDDDPFGTTPSILSTTAQAPPRSTMTTGEDEFDLLGAFSQPASSIQSNKAPPPSPPTQRGSRPLNNRSSSPPPHVLGQIVQMGFSVPQARTALEASIGPSGEWRVEQALELLIDQSSLDERQRPTLAVPSSGRMTRGEPLVGDGAVNDGGWGSDEEEDQRRRERRRRELEEDDHPSVSVASRPVGGRRAREAAAAAARSSTPMNAVGGVGSDEAIAAAQRQANELLAQASKIGFSMFKSANAYISAGKAQLQKALDERNEESSNSAGESEGGRRSNRTGGGAAGIGTTKQVPGRPKWWTEDMHDEEDAAIAARASAGSQPPSASFQDSDNEDEVLPQRPVPTARNPHTSISQGRASSAQPAPAATAAAAAVSQAAAAAAAYVSPWRRAKTPQPLSSDSLPIPQRQQTPTPRAVTPQRASTPLARTPTPRPSYPPRNHVPVSSSALTTCSAHKTKGNDLFKLGRFGDASAEYTYAIEALPSNTLHLVPLLNNRATARLKVGEEKSAAEDCSIALEILLRPYGGIPKNGERIDLGALESEKLPNDLGEFKLVEQVGKALGKRAKANEANEKWDSAGQDWALVLATGGEVVRTAGGMKVVSEGVGRCRKMLAGPTTSSNQNTSISKPIARQASPAPPRPKPVVQGSGEAVKALKAAALASEAEDDLRLSLKDSVDAKITAWKGGKEANLRALIASLDSVLWPELGWNKVGMHELISESQLKVRYVRAIAKVHPDKLKVDNTTVEQRMIAGLVFAALNDAWNAQKS